MKYAIIITVVVLSAAPTAHAQLVVNDAVNIAKNVLIAEHARQELIKAVEIAATLAKLSAKAENMAKYRTPPIAGVSHNVGRYPYGAATLTGLNSGDPVGELYDRNTRVLNPTVLAMARLPLAAQRQVSSQLADVDITDSVNQRTIQLVANSRGYASDVARAIQALEDDTLTDRTAEHYLTAVLEKLSGYALVEGRQTSVNNQLLSTFLEQLLAKAKRNRDTDVAVMNMRVNQIQGGREAAGLMQQGAGADMRNGWRMP